MDEPTTPVVRKVDTQLVRNLGSRLQKVMGEPFNDVLRLDIRRRTHHSRTGPRHLLPELLESSLVAVRELEGGQESTHLGDIVTLHALASTFERMVDDPGFPLMRPGLKDPLRFRHDVVTLGFVDHLRRSTPYTVGLPTNSHAHRRSYDFDLTNDSGSRVEFETKAPEELEGPTKSVSEEGARWAVEKSWRKAVGRNKQLKGDSSGALLLGGVTMQLQSLLTIQRAALDFLEKRGGAHHNFWGIVVFTMAVLRDKHGDVGVGLSLGSSLELKSWVQTAMARNPHYSGPVEIVPTPSKFD